MSPGCFQFRSFNLNCRSMNVKAHSYSSIQHVCVCVSVLWLFLQDLEALENGIVAVTSNLVTKSVHKCIVPLK